MGQDDSLSGLAASQHNQLDDIASPPQPALPAAVCDLLNNLPGVPRGSLARLLQETHGAELHSDFRRGMVAGLILAAEQRGELSSDERTVLMEFAIGFGGQHEYS